MIDLNEFQYLYHGSPQNNITEFDANMFGKGKGSSWGKGVYATSNYDIAKDVYARQNPSNKGHLYMVEMPADKYLYNNEVNFNQQSDWVKKQIQNWKRIPESQRAEWIKKLNSNPYYFGDEIYNIANRDLGRDAYAKDINKYLEEMGIKGRKVADHKIERLTNNPQTRMVFNAKNARILKQLFGTLPLNELSLIPEYKNIIDLIITKDRGEYSKKLEKMFNNAGINYSNGQIQL